MDIARFPCPVLFESDWKKPERKILSDQILHRITSKYLLYFNALDCISKDIGIFYPRCPLMQKKEDIYKPTEIRPVDRKSGLGGVVPRGVCRKQWSSPTLAS